MDDGNYFPPPAQSPGHDIGPDEDRHNLDPFMHPVQVVTGLHQNEDGGMEVEYERMFVQRGPDGRIYEPLDETPSRSEDSPRRWFSTDRRFRSERNRLRTFDLWLDDYKVSSSDLARDGFIHIGPGDRVKCVYCLKSLRGWESGDNVEEEHRRHFPECPWVLGQCFAENVPLDVTQRMQRTLGLKMKPATSMENFHDRLNSYPSHWAQTCCVRADALAEAGLYYIGEDDKVKCFECGTVILGWQPGDDPWAEHAKISPNCNFVARMRGAGNQINNTAESMELPSEGASKNVGIENNLTAPVQEGRPTNQELHYPQQVQSAQIDRDIQSPAVQAVLQTLNEEVSIRELTELLERIRITNGPSYKITAEDMAPLWSKDNNSKSK